MEVVSAPTQRGLWEGREQAGTEVWALSNTVSFSCLAPCRPQCRPHPSSRRDPWVAGENLLLLNSLSPHTFVLIFLF